jgi:cysteine desulfurase
MFSFFKKKRRVYLDNAAGTPAADSVVAAMVPWLSSTAGNASAIHADGVKAREAVAKGRNSVASLIDAHDDEVIFTSGGTEANMLAIFGTVREPAARAHGKHIVTTLFEHHSVERPLALLEKEGYEVTRVLPGPDGVTDPQKIAEAIRLDTVLVSVIGAHNEIGTMQPLSEIAKVIRRKRASGNFPLFHTDACQWIGNVPFSVQKTGVDLATMNAHKMYGPAGVGALFVRRGVTLEPVLLGGGQEHGMRSGTENVPGIVGFGVAAELFRKKGDIFISDMEKLRDYTISKLFKIPGVQLNGHPSVRLPGIINVSIDGIESEQLVLELDAKGFAVSSGSACATADLESRYAILALGKSEDMARSALRISLGRYSSRGDIDHLLSLIPSILLKLRRFNA